MGGRGSPVLKAREGTRSECIKTKSEGVTSEGRERLSAAELHFCVVAALSFPPQL